MSGIRRVYWDAGIFISWLSNEQRSDPDETAGILELATDFDNQSLEIVTSTLSIIEVSRIKIRPDQLKKFEDLAGRHNFLFQDMTREVATTAREIRDYYLKNRPSDDTVILTPNAIHLATAIEKNCEYLYTFDAKDKQGKSRGLIPLSGKIANRYYLEIGISYSRSKFQPKSL